MFQIWMEGYSATGTSSTAKFIATCEGKTFKEACASHFQNDKYYSEEQNSYWGCQLFNNENDARMGFG